MNSQRVLIVAENVSARFGGEAFLPLHYFRVLRKRKCEVWLVTHARVREELLQEFPDDTDRLHFIEDTSVHAALWRVGCKLPQRIAAATTGTILSALTSLEQRRLVARLVDDHSIDVVHQPIPVSPKAPSLIVNVGAPVVFGPLNGGMTFPPGMRKLEAHGESLLLGALRKAAHGANVFLPGKRKATTVLVANERTRRALPTLPKSVKVIELVENGVDFSRWQSSTARTSTDKLRLAFVGRLVPLKSVPLLLQAISQVSATRPVELAIFGDGPERSRIEEEVGSLGLTDRVKILGFVPQKELPAKLAEFDALVLPSICECGGAVILEAMALGLPAIATNWGGPADYLDSTCGFLLPVDREEVFVAALVDAITKLANDPTLGLQMGERAREKVLREFDWERKVDRMQEIYAEAIERWRSTEGAHLALEEATVDVRSSFLIGDGAPPGDAD